MMKQVANKDAILRINKEATWIEEGDLSFEVSESDGYALEEALRVREKLGGEVVVCSMGPQRVKSVIKDALARGADRAIHIVGDNLTHLSPYSAATVLADAVRDENPDLIMTGLQSDDLGYGETGVIMAELLGLPHATIVIEVDAAPEKFRVKRELESGWYQWYTMQLLLRRDSSHVRAAKRNGFDVSAPTGQRSIMLPDTSESTVRPTNVSISACSPRPDMPSSMMPPISTPKRMQRVQWMQRVISSAEMSGPMYLWNTTRFFSR
jgi:electron transfer flavoprotein alpha subunit